MQPSQSVHNPFDNIKINSVDTLEGAVRLEKDFFARLNEKFCLIQFKPFCVRWENRAEGYEEFNIFCHVNTTQKMG